MKKQTGFLTIAHLVLSVINVIGLIWLTRFSFGAEVHVDSDGKHIACVQGLDHSNLLFTRVAVSILWIHIALAVGTATSLLV